MRLPEKRAILPQRNRVHSVFNLARNVRKKAVP